MRPRSKKLDDGPSKPPTPAALKRMAIRERVKTEARGACMKCGDPGTVMAPEKDRFVLLCAKCNGRRAVTIREEKKTAKARQVAMFPEEAKS